MSDHGWEGHEWPPPMIISKYSYVTKEFYSQPVLKYVCRKFSQGQLEKAAKMYAILDGQTSHSFAISEFFDMFNVSTVLHPAHMFWPSGTTRRITPAGEFSFFSDMKGTGKCHLSTLSK